MEPQSRPGRYSPPKQPAASERPLPITVLGSVALDTLETPAARGERLLGGSATYFAAAARLLAPARIVSAVGEDFGDGDEAALRELGLDTSMLERRPGLTYAWHGRYGADFANATTVAREVGVIDGYLPPAAHANGALFLGAIDPAVQRHALDRSPPQALTALDSREAWIHEFRAEVLELAGRVDYVFLNSFELAILSGEDSVVAGAAALRGRGAGCVVIKRGADGATLFDVEGALSVPAYPTTVVDPTGAGDAFAGGFLGTLAAAPEAGSGEALRYGAALASFTLESLGIESLAQLTRGQLDERAAAIECRREA